MLEPYLELAELPEAQLQELYRFVKEMAARNDYDLAETLFELNLYIYRQFEYSPGTTNLYTTAFEVFKLRKGVCQDFAHLFICLARLLHIPARYVCGYVVSNAGSPMGPVHQATHAWVEVYLPNVGWVGFDPTNGTMAATDHVRTARG